MHSTFFISLMRIDLHRWRNLVVLDAPSVTCTPGRTRRTPVDEEGDSAAICAGLTAWPGSVRGNDAVDFDRSLVTHRTSAHSGYIAA